MAERWKILIAPRQRKGAVRKVLEDLSQGIVGAGSLDPNRTRYLGSRAGTFALFQNCWADESTPRILSGQLNCTVLQIWCAPDGAWGYQLCFRGSPEDTFCSDGGAERGGVTPEQRAARLTWRFPADAKELLPLLTAPEPDGTRCSAELLQRLCPWAVALIQDAQEGYDADAPQRIGSAAPDACTREALRLCGELEEKWNVRLPELFRRICAQGGMNWLIGANGVAEEAACYFMEPALRTGWSPIGLLETEHWRSQVDKQMWKNSHTFPSGTRFLPIARWAESGDFDLLVWRAEPEPQVVRWSPSRDALTYVCDRYETYVATRLAAAKLARPGLEDSAAFARHLSWLGPDAPLVRALRGRDSETLRRELDAALLDRDAGELWDEADTFRCLPQLSRAVKLPVPTAGVLGFFQRLFRPERGRPVDVDVSALTPAGFSELLTQFYAGKLAHLELEFTLQGEGVYVKRLKKTVYQPYALTVELVHEKGRFVCVGLDGGTVSVYYLIADKDVYFHEECDEHTFTTLAGRELPAYLVHETPAAIREELPFLFRNLERADNVFSCLARMGVWSCDSGVLSDPKVLEAARRKWTVPV